MFVFVGVSRLLASLAPSLGHKGNSNPRELPITPFLESQSLWPFSLPFSIFQNILEFVLYVVSSVFSHTLWKDTRNVHLFYLSGIRTPANLLLIFKLTYKLFNVILKYEQCGNHNVASSLQAISMCLFASTIKGSVVGKKNDLALSCVYRECKFHIYVCYMSRDAQCLNPEF